MFLQKGESKECATTGTTRPLGTTNESRFKILLLNSLACWAGATKAEAAAMIRARKKRTRAMVAVSRTMSEVNNGRRHRIHLPLQLKQRACPIFRVQSPGFPREKPLTPRLKLMHKTGIESKRYRGLQDTKMSRPLPSNRAARSTRSSSSLTMGLHSFGDEIKRCQ
jgi:hypothetical protein